jgi:hypothetical protein
VSTLSSLSYDRGLWLFLEQQENSYLSKWLQNRFYHISSLTEHDGGGLGKGRVERMGDRVWDPLFALCWLRMTWFGAGQGVKDLLWDCSFPKFNQTSQWESNPSWKFILFSKRSPSPHPVRLWDIPSVVKSFLIVNIFADISAPKDKETSWHMPSKGESVLNLTSKVKSST